ncbi:Cysteine protease atg4 [Globomyces sp. JEL0801]|nr:Cysteine protease atg4 [Globomyces sp. JEL0801]
MDQNAGTINTNQTQAIPTDQEMSPEAAETLFSRFSNGLTYFMQKAKDQLSTMDSPRDLLRFVIYPSAASTGGPLTFLSNKYPSLNDIEFLDGIITNWRIRQIEEGDWINYAEIITRFNDSPISPFSIHRIALHGQQLDKQVGEWFGPSTISQVLKVLALASNTSLNVHVAQDGVLYLEEAREELNRLVDGKKRSLMILVNLRLGLDSLNPIYHPAIKKCFEMKNFLGIAGGRPNSSLFFMGYQGNNLIYLDPHFNRACIPLKELHSYEKEDLFSYHCDKVRLLSLNQMDPSMVIGFYIKDETELDLFKQNAESICTGNTPLFSIESKPPIIAFKQGVFDQSDDDF